MFVFIFATAGLLLWAAIKPWVSRWFEVGAMIPSWRGAILILTQMAERKGTAELYTRFWRRRYLTFGPFGKFGCEVLD